MSQYSRTEIETAFGFFSASLSESARSGSWEIYAALFTDEVVYCDNGQLQWRNPEEILGGVREFYKEYPANHVADLVAGDRMINEEWAKVTFELNVVMEDPGDGSSHSLPITCVAHYAGDNKWCGQEDCYNLAAYGAFLEQWVEIHRRYSK